jgi:hypothetical protein
MLVRPPAHTGTKHARSVFPINPAIPHANANTPKKQKMAKTIYLDLSCDMRTPPTEPGDGCIHIECGRRFQSQRELILVKSKISAWTGEYDLVSRGPRPKASSTSSSLYSNTKRFSLF